MVLYNSLEGMGTLKKEFVTLINQEINKAVKVITELYDKNLLMIYRV